MGLTEVWELQPRQLLQLSSAQQQLPAAALPAQHTPHAICSIKPHTLAHMHTTTHQGQQRQQQQQQQQQMEQHPSPFRQPARPAAPLQQLAALPARPATSGVFVPSPSVPAASMASSSFAAAYVPGRPSFAPASPDPAPLLEEPDLIMARLMHMGYEQQQAKEYSERYANTSAAVEAIMEAEERQADAGEAQKRFCKQRHSPPLHADTAAGGWSMHGGAAVAPMLPEANFASFIPFGPASSSSAAGVSSSASVAASSLGRASRPPAFDDFASSAFGERGVTAPAHTLLTHDRIMATLVEMGYDEQTAARYSTHVSVEDALEAIISEEAEAGARVGSPAVRLPHAAAASTAAVTTSAARAASSSSVTATPPVHSPRLHTSVSTGNRPHVSRSVTVPPVASTAPQWWRAKPGSASAAASAVHLPNSAPPTRVHSRTLTWTPLDLNSIQSEPSDDSKTEAKLASPSMSAPLLPAARSSFHAGDRASHPPLAASGAASSLHASLSTSRSSVASKREGRFDLLNSDADESEDEPMEPRRMSNVRTAIHSTGRHALHTAPCAASPASSAADVTCAVGPTRVSPKLVKRKSAELEATSEPNKQEEEKKKPKASGHVRETPLGQQLKPQPMQLIRPTAPSASTSNPERGASVTSAIDLTADDSDSYDSWPLLDNSDQEIEAAMLAEWLDAPAPRVVMEPQEASSAESSPELHALRLGAPRVPKGAEAHAHDDSSRYGSHSSNIAPAQQAQTGSGFAAAEPTRHLCGPAPTGSLSASPMVNVCSSAVRSHAGGAAPSTTASGSVGAVSCAFSTSLCLSMLAPPELRPAAYLSVQRRVADHSEDTPADHQLDAWVRSHHPSPNWRQLRDEEAAGREHVAAGKPAASFPNAPDGVHKKACYKWHRVQVDMRTDIANPANRKHQVTCLPAVLTEEEKSDRTEERQHQREEARQHRWRDNSVWLPSIIAYVSGGCRSMDPGPMVQQPEELVRPSYVPLQLGELDPVFAATDDRLYPRLSPPSIVVLCKRLDPAAAHLPRYAHLLRTKAGTASLPRPYHADDDPCFQYLLRTQYQFDMGADGSQQWEPFARIHKWWGALSLATRAAVPALKKKAKKTRGRGKNNVK